jgi:hypothetical protein
MHDPRGCEPAAENPVMPRDTHAVARTCTRATARRHARRHALATRSPVRNPARTRQQHAGNLQDDFVGVGLHVPAAVQLAVGDGGQWRVVVARVLAVRVRTLDGQRPQHVYDGGRAARHVEVHTLRRARARVRGGRGVDGGTRHTVALTGTPWATQAQRRQTQRRTHTGERTQAPHAHAHAHAHAPPAHKGTLACQSVMPA